MNGTPYWGKETFADIRNIETLPTNELTLEKIEEFCNEKALVYQADDLYSLFLTLSNLDFLFVIEQESIFTTWCKDIRFNYRDKQIVLPYYSYKVEHLEMTRKLAENDFLDIPTPKTVNVRHSFALEGVTLDNRQTKERLNEVVLYDHLTKTKYRFILPPLPYLKELTFSLADLANRYLNSAYIKSENTDSDDWKKYLKVDTRGSKGKEHKLRLKSELPLYANAYKDTSYKDVRLYEYAELNNGSTLILDDIKPYWLRVYEFEAYLYCIFASGADVQEAEYKQDFNLLGVSKRFLTYREGVKPLVLKHYYKDKTSLRRKSFERYRV